MLSGSLACSEDTTQLLVVVDSDMTVPKPLGTVRVQIRNELGLLIGAQEFLVSANDESTGAYNVRLPFSFGILPPRDEFTTRVTVEVSALRSSTTTEPLFTRRALTGFLEGKRLLLPMFLADQCRTTMCAEGQTCSEQGCISDKVDETRLSEASDNEVDLQIRLSKGGTPSPPPPPSPPPDAGMPLPDTGPTFPDAMPKDMGFDTGVTEPVDSGVSEDASVHPDAQTSEVSLWPLVPSYMTECRGQTSNVIPCPGTAGSSDCATTPHCGQDAQYTDENMQVFVCVDVNGQDMQTCPMVASDDETVRDELTGLNWQRSQLPAQMTSAAAINYCETLNYGGQTDWRLPKVHELRSITKLAWDNPTVDAVAFPETQSDQYWTSTVIDVVRTGDRRLTVNFATGLVWANPQTQDGELQVRCVRGGPSQPPPASRFSSLMQSGGIVVTDAVTGLMWSSPSERNQNWRQALAYCEGLDYGGYDDWRLPQRNALASLINYARHYPASDFPNVPSVFAPLTIKYWSSSPRSGASGAWTVDFAYGISTQAGWSDTIYVRCVR